MQPLTIEKIKQYYLPKNASRINNFNAASHGIAVYNDSIPLYNAITLVIDEVGVAVSATDISIDQTASTVIVQSSTGIDGTIPAASTSLAGVMTASDKVRANSLITLSGVAAAATNLGTFTGTVIPNNTTIKGALQALETSLESIPDVTAGNLTSSSSVITVTNGTGAVLGSGTAVSFVPGNVDLQDLGGALTLSQIDVTTASSGDVVTYDGADLVFGPNPTPDHNDLTSIQGGTTNEYYHLNNSVYTKLNSLTTDRLLGRDTAGSGEVEQISLTGSLAFTGSTGISLVNDSASPGNSYYYGTNSGGTKGFFVLPSGVTSLAATDSSDIDITITGSGSLDITAELIPTSVSPDTYGGTSDTTVSFTVDANGRLTAASDQTISITADKVSDFNEAVDDQVAVLLTAGTGIALAYNDGAGTLTISSSNTYTDEQAQDAVGAALANSSNVTLTYVDATPTITADLTNTGVTAGNYGNPSGSAYPELTVDAKGRITSAGSRIIQILTTQITGLEEAVDDRVANLLVAGTDINITYNDLAGTLTIDSTAGAGAGAGYDTIQEEGSALTTRTVLNFIGGGITAVDNGGSTRTDVSLDATLNALAAYNTDGFLVQTAADTFAGRELTAGATNAIVITNPDGVAGDPEIEFDPTVVDINDLSGPLTLANGGIGSIGAGTANQLLGMNAAGSLGEWKTLSGTSNQITVTYNVGSTVLSTPQDIHTGASPTFRQVSVNGAGLGEAAFSASSSTDNVTLSLNSTNDSASAVITGTESSISIVRTGTSSTSDSPTLTLAADDGAVIAASHLLGEINFYGSGSSGILKGASISAIANTTFVSTTSSPADLVFSTTPVSSATPSERVRILSDGQVQFKGGEGLRIYAPGDLSYIDIIAPGPPDFGGYILTLPTTNGVFGQVLVTDGTGVLSWESPSTVADTIYNADGSISEYRTVTFDDPSSAISITGDETLLEVGQDYMSIGVDNGVTNILLDLQATGFSASGALFSIATDAITLNSTDITFTLGSDATGDIFYRNSGGNLTRLPIGTSGQVLTVDTGLPSWEDSAGSAVAAGANYQVQYYDTGNLAADASFNFDPTNNRLVVGHTSANATLHGRSHNSTGSSVILAEDSSGNDIISIKSDGYVKFGTNEVLPVLYQSASVGGAVNYSGGGLTLQGFQSFGASYDILGITHTELTDGVDGPHSILKLVGTYSPSSGSSGVYAGIIINQTIDQTGTFTGDSFGIFIAPDLTSVEGTYTGIQVTVDDPNSYGFVQAGSSGINSFAGFTGIGTVAPTTELEVVGTTTSTHYVGGGSSPTFTLGSSTIVGTGATYSIAGTDSGFELTLNTGTGVSAIAGPIGTINFASAYSSAPIIIPGIANAQASTFGGRLSITSATTTTAIFGAGGTSTLASSSTYKWNFIIIGK